MNIVILDKGSLGEDTPLKELSQFGNVTFYDSTPKELISDRIRSADIVIVNKVKLTDEIFSAAKSLRLVCVFATGYDNIDVAAAKRHSIAVCNVPKYSTESVTLFTAATVLSLVTHLNSYRQFVADGSYSNSDAPNMLTPVYHEINGKTWGIVGFGSIGRSVAKVATAFGAKILVCTRTQTNDTTCVDIDTLCRESDIITLHCPLTADTRHIIDKDRIASMKPGAILVNEARGAVVDEEAVADALLEGRLAGFGSDVYSTEPFLADHPFYKIKSLENVILTPHAAWGSYESRVRCLKIIIKNIRSFLDGIPLNRVDLLN